MWREICGAALTFVILFWNVENYFDPFDDPLKNDDEFTPGAVRHWTWSRFEAKRDGIAQTIVAAGDAYGELPALVGLAEVENRMVVSQLVHKTMLDELGYGFVHRESPDERGIDVALLYRKDLLRVVAVDSLRIPGVVTRDILYVHLRCPVGAGHDENFGAGRDEWDTRHARLDRASLHVFVVHFPSKRGGEKESRDRREAAQAVLERAVDSLLALDPDSRIVVMGDFNDTQPRIAGLAIPPRAEAPVNAAVASQSAPGTLKYHGRWEQIDWLFVSPALAPDARLDIFAPAFLLEPDAAWLGTKPRRTYIGPRYNRGLSDHLPIRAVLPF